MRGILVVNSFLCTPKFSELHSHISGAAEMLGIDFEILTNTDIALSLPKADFALFWDKDINAARRLERSGIPVFNSADSIMKCDDKARTYIELLGDFPQAETIASPKTFFNNPAAFSDFVDEAADRLGLPLVFKECFGSFGEQVFLCRSKADIMKRITERPFILQKYIGEFSGCDLRLEVVGDEVAAAVKRQNKSDFRANAANGGTMEKYEPTEEQERTAVAACRRLGLTFGGVDMLPDGTIIEVNSNAHIINIMRATGTDIAPKIFEEILNRISL